jgi:hypothetical protein
MSKIATTFMSLQLGTLHNLDPLVGLKVNLPRHCPCGHDMLHVGPAAARTERYFSALGAGGTVGGFLTKPQPFFPP